MVVSKIVEYGILESVYGAISTLLHVIAWVGIIAVGIPILCIQVPKNKNYQNALYEKQVLEYRLEHNSENEVGNELLYSDIVKFNESIRNDKKYANNFWVGLFYNDKIAEIDYIEIDGIKPFN